MCHCVIEHHISPLMNKKRNRTFWPTVSLLLFLTVCFLVYSNDKQQEKFSKDYSDLEIKMLIQKIDIEALRNALPGQSTLTDSTQPDARVLEVDNFSGVLLWYKNDSNDTSAKREYLSHETQIVSMGVRFFKIPLNTRGYELRGKKVYDEETQIIQH